MNDGNICAGHGATCTQAHLLSTLQDAGRSTRLAQALRWFLLLLQPGSAWTQTLTTEVTRLCVMKITSYATASSLSDRLGVARQHLSVGPVTMATARQQRYLE